MVYRICSSCNRNLSGNSYSVNQWRKGEGCSRCHSCVNGGYWHGDLVQEEQRYQQQVQKLNIDPSETARINDATTAEFFDHDLHNPFASGSFRWVAKGRYTEGNRAGQECVCKWFKKGGVFEARYFQSDLETVQKAIELITKWNESRFVDKMVKINKPEVWTLQDGDFAGRKVLQEPFIPNYQKFNSNTGWADDSMPWPRVMQALSHYTFHVSGGTALLCDLQGGVFSNGVCLTDPVVMSIERKYGPTDLGYAGMESFFYNHTCNEFCRSTWMRIQNPRRCHIARKGSTMEHVPTRQSRAPMSMGLGAIYE